MADDYRNSKYCPTLTNLAKKKKTRVTIDQELGLDHEDTDMKEFDKTEDDEVELDGKDLLLTDDLEHTKDEFASMAEDLLSEQGSNEEHIWAEKEIEKLLTLIPKSEAADLIRKVMLWGYDYEELAYEEHCSVAYMYTMVNRAMTSLMKVALPYIKVRCRKIFVQNAADITNEYERKILDEFFSTSKSLDEIALSYHKKTKLFTKDLINAFRKVKKIHQGKVMGYRTDDDIADYLDFEMRQDAQNTMLKVKKQQIIA